MCCGVKFLTMSLLMQDTFTEDDWEAAVQAVATAKVKKVYMWFNDKSVQRPRAVETITNGLAKNRFIQSIKLSCVPKAMKAEVKRKLCDSVAPYNIYIYI